MGGKYLSEMRHVFRKAKEYDRIALDEFFRGGFFAFKR